MFPVLSHEMRRLGVNKRQTISCPTEVQGTQIADARTPDDPRQSPIAKLGAGYPDLTATHQSEFFAVLIEVVAVLIFAVDWWEAVRYRLMYGLSPGDGNFRSFGRVR